MPPIFFRCMSCNHELRVAEEKAGEEIECPECGFVGKVPVPFKGQTGSRLRGAHRQKKILSLPPAYRAEAEITGRMEAQPPVSESLYQAPLQRVRDKNWDQTWEGLSSLYLTTGVRLLVGLATFVIVVLLPSYYLVIKGSDLLATVFSVIALVAVITFAAVTTLLQISDVSSYSRCMHVPGKAGRKALIAITIALSLLSFVWNLAIPVVVIVFRSGSVQFSQQEPFLAWAGATLLNPIALARWLVFLLFLLSVAHGLKATTTVLSIGGLLTVAAGCIVVLLFPVMALVVLSLDPKKGDPLGWGYDCYFLLIWFGYVVTVSWYLVVLRRVRDEVNSSPLSTKTENSEGEAAG